MNDGANLDYAGLQKQKLSAKVVAQLAGLGQQEANG